MAEGQVTETYWGRYAFTTLLAVLQQSHSCGEFMGNAEQPFLGTCDGGRMVILEVKQDLFVVWLIEAQNGVSLNIFNVQNLLFLVLSSKPYRISLLAFLASSSPSLLELPNFLE